MNETFNFNRFVTYFKYDLKQMWRNHSRAAMLIGGASALLYAIWVMFSLVLGQGWTSPVLGARVAVFMVAFAILEFYQVRVYGHLTEKRAGSTWLMIPASRAEKFVSMLVITLIVIPVMFFAVYMLLDGFLSIVDPTYGKALIGSVGTAYTEFINGLAELGEQTPFTLTPSMFIVGSFFSAITSFLYFNLCGICFKRNKLVCAIAILFGVSMVLSLLSGIILPHIFANWPDYDVTEEIAIRWINNVMYIGCSISALMAIGLGWGIWHRVKTLQH